MTRCCLRFSFGKKKRNPMQRSSSSIIATRLGSSAAAALSATHSVALLSSTRHIIVPKQLKAYGDVFSPSVGDRSDHLAGHFVLQKLNSTSVVERSPLRKVKTTCSEDFREMGLSAEVRQALSDMEITIPSPIQQSGIEAVTQKKDVMLAAPHGEGKTVAFLAPVYSNMMKDRDVYKIPLRERRPRCILLAPTRETAEQLAAVCRRFDATTGLHSEVFTSRKRAAYHLNRMLKTTKVDVLIMHPRVVLKLIRARRLFIDDLRYYVVDEADIMCSSQHDHDAVILAAKIQKRMMYKHLWPVQTQFIFSTAFITRKLEYYLGARFPKLVACYRTKSMHLPSPTVRQRFYPMRRESEKMDMLQHLLKKHGHRPKDVLTDEDEVRVSKTFTPLRNATHVEGRKSESVVSEPKQDGLEEDGNEVARESNNSISSIRPADAVSVSQAGNELGSSTTLHHRIAVERIKPTAWGHLSTIAAPFTSHIPRSVFDVDGKSTKKRAMIFLRDIDSCTAIYHRLCAAGYTCCVMHAALPWAVRKEMYRRFASGECDIMCTTDVMSRGIDVHVDLVINFHMPTNAVTYLSRLGRVGRMGRAGTVVSMYTKQQGVIVSAIRTFAKGDIPLHQISNWSPHMTQPRYSEWRVNKMNAVSKAYVSMITKKTIPAHLERTYLRHNATWRPLYHPNTISHHGGVAPTQQHKLMDKVKFDAVEFRKGQLARRKGGRAKFGSRYAGVWNSQSGPDSGFVANLDQNANPGGIGVPEGPPR